MAPTGYRQRSYHGLHTAAPTSQAVKRLDPEQLWFHPLDLSGDVRVRDLFRLFEHDPEFWYTVFPGPTVREIVQDGLRKGGRRLPRRADSQALTFSWLGLQLSTDGVPKAVSLPWRMDVDITGRDGTRSWGIDFLPPSDVAPLKLRVETELPYSRQFHRPGRRLPMERQAYSHDVAPALGHVLNALLGELGWWGSPRDAKQGAARIRESLRDMGAGVFYDGDEVHALSHDPDRARADTMRAKIVQNHQAEMRVEAGGTLDDADRARQEEVGRWLLEVTMRAASEDLDGARWGTDAEFVLWQDVLEGGEAPFEFDQPDWVYKASTLSALARRAGGWFRHEDGVGVQFVSLAEWERIYAARWASTHPARSLEERNRLLVAQHKAQLEQARQLARKRPRGRVIGGTS